MNNSFAGFWRDGAVVKPEARHFDEDDCVIARHKDNGSLGICISGDRDWHKVYWLDTTATEATSDKPDPGEGWRLLDPCEDVEAGDEYFFVGASEWLMANNHRSYEGKQTANVNYRRRIAPQYVPYTWDDRDELRGRWFRRKTKESWQTNYERLACFFCLIDGHFYVNSIRNDELLNECEWLDGKPCGKVV